MLTLTRYLQELFLTDLISNLIGVSTAYPYLHLFTNNVTPSPTSVIADFTEADYTGYASQPIPGVGAVGWASQGAAVAYSGPVIFAPTGTAVTNIIYGYYITDSGSTHLWGAALLPSPYSMTDPTTILNIVTPWNVADGGITPITY
jgi:hypothetical protein